MEIIKMNEQTWRIENDGVRIFLLIGSEKALLIDSGMTLANAKEVAESLTDLPLELINTHADRDHTSGNAAFDFAYMHLAECSNYYHSKPDAGAVKPVWDGDIIDLGERELEIIHIPGHTPGSIAILDRKYRVLIGGDSIQDGAIYMFGVQREMHAYIHSMERLEKRMGEFDEVYPSHSSIPVSPDMIGKLKIAAQEVLAGKYPVEVKEMHGNRIHYVNVGIAGFLVD